MLNPEAFEYRNMSNDDYNSTEYVAEGIASATCLYKNKSMMDIDYHDVLDYFNYSHNLKFVSFGTNANFVDQCVNMRKLGIGSVKYSEIDPVFQDAVCGFTIPTAKRAIVLLNGSLYYPRLVFTVLHELSHVFSFYTNPSYLKAFTILNSSDPASTYPEEILPYENAANAMASNLLINTPALCRSLTTGTTFNQLIKKYTISQSALHNRIWDYLVHYLEWDQQIAYNFLMKYRYQGTDGANLMKKAMFSY